MMLAFLFFAFLACETTQKPVPSAAVASVEMARGNFERGDYHLVIHKLSPYVRRFPEVFDLKMLLGLAYLGNGDLHEAETFFKAALKLDRRSDDAKLNLAYTLIQAQRYTEAQVWLDRMLKKNTYPNIEKVYINYGLIFLLQNNCEKAIPYFKKALVYDPTSSSAFYNLGFCAKKEDHLIESLDYLKKAFKYCPDCYDPGILYAESLHQSHHSSEAIEVISKLLKNKKLSQKQRQQLSHLKKTMLGEAI
jgi:Tfp pilus assembly protein PilF